MSYVARAKKLWVLLFLIRTAGLLIGLDRLPMVPTVNPEVVINDPAVSLSRGHGFVAYSFDHSVNGLDKLYAHFPPVFIWLQALVFRVFGFSAISLRALSVICDLGTCLAFLLVVIELEERGILDRLGAMLAGILIVLEPTAMIHAREGRMESLNTMLGGFAFLLCLRAGAKLGTWMGASLLIGIALATHPAAALMWVAFEAWTLIEFRKLGFWRWIAINAVAPVVMLVFWLIAYGTHLGDAVAQMRHLSIFAGAPDLRIIDLIQSLRHGAAAAAQNAGGLGLIFTLAAFVWAIWRAFDKHPAPAGWHLTLVTLIAILAIQLLMLQFLIPTSGMNRAVMIFPFALICAGVALSHMSKAAARNIKTVGAIAIALQAGMILLYIAQLRHAWNDRSPDRFDSIVAAAPAGALVAGPPELWYGFRDHDRQFTVIYRAMGEIDYWNTPNAFDSYDVVILDPNWPTYEAWRQKASAGRPVSRMVHTYQRDFLVLAKSLNGN